MAFLKRILTYVSQRMRSLSYRLINRQTSLRPINAFLNPTWIHDVVLPPINATHPALAAGAMPYSGRQAGTLPGWRASDAGQESTVGTFSSIYWTMTLPTMPAPCRQEHGFEEGCQQKCSLRKAVLRQAVVSRTSQRHRRE